MTPNPRVSVVIPTYQGCDLLRVALEALGRQTLAGSEYEVIVSVDGSTDGTRLMLEQIAPPFRLDVTWRPANGGRAAACNAGIRRCRADLIVLLDDDMEPCSTFLESHLKAHAGSARRGVLGAVPVTSDETSPAVVRYVASRFNRHMAKLAEPGYPIGYRDFYTGNFSIGRGVLFEAGLFDESFTAYGNEDVEFGLRLRRAGVELVYSPDALARQHYDKSIAELADDHMAKGRTAVLLASKHPDAPASSRLSTYRRGSRSWRALRTLLLAATRLAPSTVRGVVHYLEMLERRNVAMLERHLPLALDYLFWAGASSAMRARTSPRMPMPGRESRTELRTTH